MDYVWEHPGCAAEECREALAAVSRPLKDSTVRTLLHRLERKGYVVHEVEGRSYLYRASEVRRGIAARAVKQIMDRFCDGSLEELLVGMVENDFIRRDELKQLGRKISLRKREHTDVRKDP